jgi:hypothetical protein
MNLDRTAFASAAMAATPARFRVEKASAGKRLDGEERRKARGSAASARGRAAAASSRFETNTRFPESEIHPASGFAAQVLGQMLASGGCDAVEAERAYARAIARDLYARPIKYA